MRTHVDGSAVDQTEYIDSQAKLIAKFSTDMLNSGPEQYQVAGQEWKMLDEMARRGIEAGPSNIRELNQNPYIAYLTHQWVQRYAHLFGNLSAADIPIEVIESEVGAYQHTVSGHIANIRHLWQERTGVVLDLQSSWEQAQRIPPKIVDYSEPALTGASEPYYQATTLFPHVITTHEDGIEHHNLLLANGSVHPETLLVPIKQEVRAAVEQDMKQYSQK